VLQPVQLTAQIGLPLIQRGNFGFLNFILCYVGVYVFSNVVDVALIVLVGLQHVLLDLITCDVDDSVNGFLYLGGVEELVGLFFIFFILGTSPSAVNWKIRISFVLNESCSCLVLQLGICGLVVDLLVAKFRDLILNFFYFDSLALDFWAQGSRVIRERVVLLSDTKRSL